MSDKIELPTTSPESSTGKPSAPEAVQPSAVATPERPESGSPELLKTNPQSSSPNGSPQSEAAASVKQPKESIMDPVKPEPDGPGLTSDVVKPGPPVQTIQLSHAPSQKIAVEIHNPPNSKGFLKVCGRFFRALARDYGVLIATVVIAYFGYAISKQQVAAELEQSKAAEEEVNVKFIEEFKNHLGELMPASSSDEDVTNEDLRKKRLTAITLAQYGDRALPALKMSLSVDESDIREGAAVVVAQMLSDTSLRPTVVAQAVSETSLRQTVLSKLKEYFDENNTGLRIGVLECYLTINTGLTATEFEEARKKITDHVNPAADYTNKPQDQRVVLWAVKFFSYWPRSTVKDFLLTVARNTTCNDETREGVLNLLPSVIKDANDLTAAQRKTASDDAVKILQDLFPHASERLQKNLTATITSLQNQ
jgi:hypothetical protein